MSEESWHLARLIPTSGISGPDEQERRATSALLAVMCAVREYGRAILAPLGAPAGNVEAFIEVPFKLQEAFFRPDGLIRVRRGSRVWTTLVEVKTGTVGLDVSQVEAYLDIARGQGFDSVLTISNEIPPLAGAHPLKVDRRKIRSVSLHHYSWSQLLSEAVMQKEHRGVADPDQAWILGELIRYLEHPRSGALEFQDMGSSWTVVRDAVAASTLRANDKVAPEVANRFDALLRYASLRLGRRLGTEVTPVLSRKEMAEPTARVQALVSTLASTGTLGGLIRIPNTVGPLEVVADLRTGKVTCQVEVSAPREGRPSTRVNWLLRQMKSAPERTRVEAWTARSHGASSAELLRDVRENPMLLVPDPTRELRNFRIALDSPLGAKRGAGRGSFIESVVEAIEFFYVEVMQNLKGWTAQPPKVREVPELPPQERVLGSVALSSQDGPEVADSESGSSRAREDTDPEPGVTQVEEAPSQWVVAWESEDSAGVRTTAPDAELSADLDQS